MEKVNVSNKAPVAQQGKDEAAAKAEPKVEFGSLLQQKQAEQAAAKPAAQAAAQAQAGAGRLTAEAMKGQGVSMAAQQQGGLAAGKPAINRPMVQNPHLAKMQEASKHFDAQLNQAKAASVEGQKQLGSARAEAHAADQARTTGRADDVARTENRGEVARQLDTENHGQAKVRQEAQQSALRQLGHARQQNRADMIAGAGVTESSKANAVAGTKAARKTQEIPQELLDKLVEEVRVGVNEAGQSEFQIDLKEGVLQGMTLRVTADNGKVKCHFIGGNNAAKHFIEASEGSLARGLESRGLMLDRLQVTSA